MGEEPFVDFPVPRALVPVCTEVRSTVLATSILAIKKHGHFERYEPLLPADRRDEILYAIPGQWLPVELGLVHYRACEAMGLSWDEIVAIGHSVAELGTKAVFSFFLKRAPDAGANPWVALGAAPTHWTRSYQGSAAAVFKLGPREARMEVVNNPLASIPYFRASLQGITHATAASFASHVSVRELTWQPEVPFRASYRVSWA